METLKQQKLKNSDILVSFDISPFTQLPVSEAINVTEEKYYLEKHIITCQALPIKHLLRIQ